MSWAVGSGRVAEMPNTDTPSSARWPEAALVSATKRAIGDVRRPVEPGELHRGEVALGPADVVVEDLVEAEADGLDGQVDLVLADLGVGEVA